jgi:hypothetical protein
MGEYCGFHIGRFCAGMSAPEWTHFRHQDYDGSSAFAHLMRTRTNTEIDIRTSPNPPSTWTLFVALLRLIFDAIRRRSPMRWRRLDRSWRPGKAPPSRPTAAAWSLFSKEETRRLAERARSHGVSLQAWLLWALKETILPELVPGSGVLAWYVPVSMHGAFSSTEQSGNSNFSLEVRFPPEAGPEDIHKAIRQELRMRRHWVIAKATFSLARPLPTWLFRTLARLAVRQTPWQGTFSNSGALAPPETADAEADIEEWFIGLAPVIKCSPLAVGCVEWKGRLALSVQVHPALATDPQFARDWMKSWRRFAMGVELTALPAGLESGAISSLAPN